MTVNPANHKGSWCPYSKEPLWCSEGMCNDCYVWVKLKKKKEEQKVYKCVMCGQPVNLELDAETWERLKDLPLSVMCWKCLKQTEILGTHLNWN